MSNIKFVPSGSNFTQLGKFQEQASSQNLKPLNSKTKSLGNYQVWKILLSKKLGKTTAFIVNLEAEPFDSVEVQLKSNRHATKGQLGS